MVIALSFLNLILENNFLFLLVYILSGIISYLLSLKFIFKINLIKEFKFLFKFND